MFLSKVKVFAVVALVACGTGAALWAGTRSGQEIQPPDARPLVVQAPRPAGARAANQGPNNREDPQPIAAMDAAKVKARLASSRAPARLKSLLRERHDVACKYYELRYRQFLAGRGTFDILLQASRELLEAEIDLSDTSEVRVEAWTNHLRRMKDLEAFVTAMFEAGRVSQPDKEQARIYRLSAEIGLERAVGR
jgi:outer membrane protein TolC